MKEDPRLDKLGILITSHPKQQKFWKYGLGSWEGCPLFLLMGYDDENTDELPLDQIMPPVNEMFVTGRPKGHIGHFKGELVQMRQGGLLLQEKGFEYIFKTAADTEWWRWRNLQKMWRELGDNDFIYKGTTVLFGRLDAFNKCMELWDKRPKCGGAELYFNSQVRTLGIKYDIRGDSFWQPFLGRSHTQGEYALNNDINVTNTWTVGQVWGEDYKHKDISSLAKQKSSTLILEAAGRRKDDVRKIKELGKWYQTIHLDDELSTPGAKNFGEPTWEMMEPFLPDVKGKWVLDIGCNAGCFSFHLCRKGAKSVLGIDASERYLAQARFVKEYLEQKEGREYPVEFSQVKLQFEKEPNILDHIQHSFPVVFLSAFIHHVKPVEKVAEKLFGLATQSLVAWLVVDKNRTDLAFIKLAGNLGWKVAHDGSSPKRKRYCMVYEKVR